MSDFKTTTESGQVLPDELDKKIEEANKSLVDTRVVTEGLEKKKANLTQDVIDLEAKKVVAEERVSVEEKKKANLVVESIAVAQKIADGKKELEGINADKKVAQDELTKLNDDATGIKDDLKNLKSCLRLGEWNYCLSE